MTGGDSQGRRKEATGDQSQTLGTYSGTTCLICGFTYPSTALTAQGKTVMRTKVSGSSPMQSVSSPCHQGLSRDEISHGPPVNTCQQTQAEGHPDPGCNLVPSPISFSGPFPCLSPPCQGSRINPKEQT